ncbi:hypothetical protein WKS98_02230 [Lagierella sp. ICN-221743]
MIKKMLVNSWMLNDHDPTDPGTVFVLDFNVDDEIFYGYFDILPKLGKHYYDYHTKEENGEVVDVSDIGIGYLDSAIECEFKDFPEELNVYLVNENMKVKDYLIKRFCIDKEPIPEAIKPTNEELIEIWKKKRQTTI